MSSVNQPAAFNRLDRARPLGVLVKTYPKLSETFILEEVLGLERRGLSLRLYSLQPATDAIAHPDVARVRAPLVVVPAPAFGNLGTFALRHLRLLATAPLRYLMTLLVALQRGRTGVANFMRAGWLAEQLRRDGVPHLHSHFISTPADIAEIVASLNAMPFSISAHAKDIYLAKASDLRRKLQSAAFTVTCTEFNYQTLLALTTPDKVQRMYHGIDHGTFHPRRRLPEKTRAMTVPLLLSVGRLRAKKGLDTLIDACALLRNQGVAFRCEIVGYGEEQAPLEARIAQHGLGGSVRLLGKLRRAEVIACYARTAVYVQPSRIAADGDR